MDTFQPQLLANPMLLYDVKYLEMLRNNLMSQLEAELGLNQTILENIVRPSNSEAVPFVQIENKPRALQESTDNKKNTKNKFIRKEISPEREIVSMQSKMKNDTKNIPKNYGKAILTHIQKTSYRTKKVVAHFGLSYPEFMSQVRKNKTRINSIADLRKMWGEKDPENKVKKCFRILSHEFMRKHCLMYIFNSRVKNFGTHIKYRRKIMEGVQKPTQFTNIKEY